jgi:Holliday junction resolvase
VTPEGKTKAAARKVLDEAGVYYFFPATHGYGRSGVPDIIACVSGRFLAIECKAEGGKTTALQEREMQRVRDAGGQAYVIGPEGLEFLRDVVAVMKESPV